MYVLILRVFIFLPMCFILEVLCLVKIEPVTDDEREMLQTSRGRRGRIAWAIVKEFEDSGLDVARIETERPTSSVVPLLRAYIKKHKLNLKISTRQSVIYIMKVEPIEAEELTPEVVDKH